MMKGMRISRERITRYSKRKSEKIKGCQGKNQVYNKEKCLTFEGGISWQLFPSYWGKRM